MTQTHHVVIVSPEDEIASSDISVDNVTNGSNPDHHIQVTLLGVSSNGCHLIQSAGVTGLCLEDERGRGNLVELKNGNTLTYFTVKGESRELRFDDLVVGKSRVEKKASTPLSVQSRTEPPGDNASPQEPINNPSIPGGLAFALGFAALCSLLMGIYFPSFRFVGFTVWAGLSGVSMLLFALGLHEYLVRRDPLTGCGPR